MTGLPTSLRWPAEWEPHDGTAFTWPHNRDTWHRGVDAPRRAVTAAVLALARDEHVYLHFPDAQTCHETMAGLGEAGASVTGRVVPSNDAWCRDHGALIVRRPDGRRLALDFGFNAWGGKYPPWDLDADIAAQMAGYLDIERVSVPFVLEGGALDGNGQGVVMTTASCVLQSQSQCRRQPGPGGGAVRPRAWRAPRLVAGRRDTGGRHGRSYRQPGAFRRPVACAGRGATKAGQRCATSDGAQRRVAGDAGRSRRHRAAHRPPAAARAIYGAERHCRPATPTSTSATAAC